VLAVLGLLTVVLVLGLILTRVTTPLVALILVPVAAAVVAGAAAELGTLVTSGITQTAPVAATFIFAILFFGILTDAGMLDPIVDRIVHLAGADPVRIVVGSAVLAAIVHLDGSGAVTFLVTIPAVLPLYERLRMDKRVLACVVAMSAGVMNMLPWGGPTLRAAASLHLPLGELFGPLVPVLAVGMAAVMAIAFWLGRGESKRLARIGAVLDRPVGPTTRTLTDGERGLRRPRMLWLNLALTATVLVVMIASLAPPAVVFMLGTVVALTINYPKASEQRARIDAHATSALMMAAILLAAGAFTGIMRGTGMLTAMATAAVDVVPAGMATHIPFALGLLSMPLSLMFDPDSFYLGVLPVVAEVAGTLGVPAMQVGQAALMGQMTTGFPVSPLTPATFLLVGLTGVDLAEHQRFTVKYLFLLSVVMTMTAVLLGLFPL